jgi:hypothetical protein
VNRHLTRVVLLALAVGAAGCGGGGYTAATKLKIEVSRDAGVRSYRLECDPAAGTAPDPGAICSELRRDPKLLVGGLPIEHSCPPFDSETFRVSGTYRGYSIDATVPPGQCEWVPGQEGANASWSRLMRNAGPGVSERPAKSSPSISARSRKLHDRLWTRAGRLRRERLAAIRSGALVVRPGQLDPLGLAFMRTLVRFEALGGPEILSGRVYSARRGRVERQLEFSTSRSGEPVYLLVLRYAFRDYTGRRHPADGGTWAIYDGQTLESTDEGIGGQVSTAGLGPGVALTP